MKRQLEIAEFSRSRRQLAYTARISGYEFTTSIWYDSVDFEALERVYTPEFLRRIYFHIVAFDVNRLVSLKPDTIEFGCFRDLVTPDFGELWQRILKGVWAQWRYENAAPGYAGPAIGEASVVEPAPVTIQPGAARNLAFCGGGKDSLFALNLLTEAGEAFDSLVYSHSIYGNHATQHRLIDRLLDQTCVRGRHRVWICDDFLPLPVLELEQDFGVRTITAAETPASAFLALPVALAHGLEHLVLAHEKSADAGNMRWDVTGEIINHQWGKSFEAERLLSEYISRHLVRNARYFSLLKPVHDVVIFSALRELIPAVASAHSCNVEKPWCKRCAKCAYVYLNYAAYLPEAVVHDIFGENLFDSEENQIWFRQMLGLEEHTPFECVGQVEEARLAFALCRARGHRGKAMELATASAVEVMDSLFAVDAQQHLIPRVLAAKVLPLLERKAVGAREFVRAHTEISLR